MEIHLIFIREASLFMQKTNKKHFLIKKNLIIDESKETERKK